MRWVVIGAGSIGRRHLRNLLALGERDLVAVRHERAPLDADLAAIPVTDDLAAAVATETAAIICTPTSRHLEDALAAVRLGCHVLVEKPLSDRLDRVAELEEELRRRERLGAVAHCFRFHPVVRRLREELAGGQLGTIRGAAVWCGQHLEDWQPGTDYHARYSARRDLGGGVLLDLVHELDYAQLLFGAVRSVTAMVRNTGALGIETEEIADLVLDHGRMRTGCHLDYLARPAVRGGWLQADAAALRWDLLGSGRVERWREGHWKILALPSGDMYREELVAFGAAIRRGGSFERGIESGARAVAIALAARQSSESGRAVTLGA
jgi:predicted dehydrogenase